MNVELQLFNGVVSLESAYHMAVAHEEHDKLVQQIALLILKCIKLELRLLLTPQSCYERMKFVTIHFSAGNILHPNA